MRRSRPRSFRPRPQRGHNRQARRLRYQNSREGCPSPGVRRRSAAARRPFQWYTQPRKGSRRGTRPSRRASCNRGRLPLWPRESPRFQRSALRPVLPRRVRIPWTPRLPGHPGARSRSPARKPLRNPLPASSLPPAARAPPPRHRSPASRPGPRRRPPAHRPRPRPAPLPDLKAWAEYITPMPAPR